MTRLAPLLLLVAATSATAAQRITWDDLRRRLPETNHRGIGVITRDGRKLHGRRLILYPSRAVISGQSVPSAAIARIEIRDRAINAHKIKESAALGRYFITEECTGSDNSSPAWKLVTCPLGAIISIPFFAIPVVGTPIVLVEDAIALFHRARIYDVIP